MSRQHSIRAAATVAAVALGLVLAAQADAQSRGNPGGAAAGVSRGGTGGFGNSSVGTDHGWPRGTDMQALSRLPADKAFGKKGKNASNKKAANAEGAAENGGAKAGAAIATAGTGGPTGKGQGSDAGVEGRAIAATAVSDHTGAEVPDGTSEDAATAQETEEATTDKGRSADAPGHTGQTGLTQAALRANEHAKTGLDKAVSHQQDDEDSSQPPQD